MTTQDKKKKIKELVINMLSQSQDAMIAKIDKALNCGALDIDDWEANSNPMVVPKIITIVLLEGEVGQHDAKGTSFEKEVKKEVKNLKCFI